MKIFNPLISSIVAVLRVTPALLLLSAAGLAIAHVGFGLKGQEAAISVAIPMLALFLLNRAILAVCPGANAPDAEDSKARGGEAPRWFIWSGMVASVMLFVGIVALLSAPLYWHVDMVFAAVGALKLGAGLLAVALAVIAAMIGAALVAVAVRANIFKLAASIAAEAVHRLFVIPRNILDTISLRHRHIHAR